MNKRVVLSFRFLLRDKRANDYLFVSIIFAWKQIIHNRCLLFGFVYLFCFFLLFYSSRSARCIGPIRHQKFESLRCSMYDVDQSILNNSLFVSYLDLINRIHGDNILLLLATAYKYNNLLLKHHCINFFLRHSKKVMSVHTLWKAFADKYPIIVAELLYWIVHPQEFTEKNLPTNDGSQW
jgi:hypothetical protein